MICCKEIAQEGIIDSPFYRILATGYYDGPTEGFIECSICKGTYVFRMLDWDDEQDMRIYAMALIDANLKEINLKIMQQEEMSSSVVIVPPLTDVRKEMVDSFFSVPFSRIAVAYDLQKELLIWKEIVNKEFAKGVDWFSRLNLARK